jgi:hypothetical protein
MAMTAAEDLVFTEFLMTKAAEAERALKYRPTQFLQMLASSGGYATAVQLLSSRRISEGFETLWSKKRLDLAVEALVLESHWRKHFDPVLLEIATKRLRGAKYEPRVSGDPLTRPTSPAPSVSVVIEWEETIENIPLAQSWRRWRRGRTEPSRRRTRPNASAFT